MYDLTKIIVLKYTNDPELIIMRTEGMKITDIYYSSNKGYYNDEEEMKKEIKSELYDDMYDDDLNIILEETLNGELDTDSICSFIDDIWNPDTLLYTYGFDNTELSIEMSNYNGKIYVSDYFDIFMNGNNIEKDIVDIMKEQGLDTSVMLKDSKISFMYFLHALVEKIISK